MMLFSLNPGKLEKYTYKFTVILCILYILYIIEYNLQWKIGFYRVMAQMNTPWPKILGNPVHDTSINYRRCSFLILINYQWGEPYTKVATKGVA